MAKKYFFLDNSALNLHAEIWDHHHHPPQLRTELRRYCALCKKITATTIRKEEVATAESILLLLLPPLPPISILIMIVLYFDPKISIFKIESINVKALGLSSDSGLIIDLLVAVRAKNPNKNIEFIYGVGIEYSGVDICGGELPAFQQGGESTTGFKVELKGKSAFRREMVEVLMEQQSGRIPAMVKLKVPVVVVVREMRVREFNLFANMSLVLDGFSLDVDSSIVSAETVFRIQIL